MTTTIDDDDDDDLGRKSTLFRTSGRLAPNIVPGHWVLDFSDGRLLSGQISPLGKAREEDLLLRREAGEQSVRN